MFLFACCALRTCALVCVVVCPCVVTWYLIPGIIIEKSTQETKKIVDGRYDNNIYLYIVLIVILYIANNTTSTKLYGIQENQYDNSIS